MTNLKNAFMQMYLIKSGLSLEADLGWESIKIIIQFNSIWDLILTECKYKLSSSRSISHMDIPNDYTFDISF